MVPGVKKVSSSVSSASVSISSSLVCGVPSKSLLSVPSVSDAASCSMFMVWREEEVYWAGILFVVCVCVFL